MEIGGLYFILLLQPLYFVKILLSTLSWINSRWYSYITPNYINYHILCKNDIVKNTALTRNILSEGETEI